MKEMQHDSAIRLAVSHLSQTCVRNGHYAALYSALEIANPALAHQHLEMTGRDPETAGVALGMTFDDEGDQVTTVLASYLFGDAALTLRLIGQLCHQLSTLPPGSLASRINRANDVLARRKMIATKRKRS